MIAVTPSAMRLLAAPPPRLALPAVATGAPTLDVVHHADLLTLCRALPEKSVDMILCDLPYGTTACDWDEVIPFEPMWAQFKRVIKRRGAIVLTASQPFTSRLVMSNLEMLKPSWVWDKRRASNFLSANRAPLQRHEDILVFGLGGINYYPQMTRTALHRRGGSLNFNNGSVYGGRVPIQTISDENYPTSILEFPTTDNAQKYHPTQKPVALFEYLIRTYTRPGEIVLDPCAGSGTTAIAARNTGRHWICGDILEKYVKVAKDRLAQPFTPPLASLPAQAVAPAVQEALFP